MNSTPPTREQRFVLDHISDIAALGVDADTADAVLEGASDFVSREWGSLARIGDTVGGRSGRPSRRLIEAPAVLDTLATASPDKAWQPVRRKPAFAGWTDDYGSILPRLNWTGH